jgi:hypothetical protein
MTDTAPLDAPPTQASVAQPLPTVAVTLQACSICLRVRDQDEWIDVETAIQLVRSFESECPPRLLPAICDSCATSIAARRGGKPRGEHPSSAPTEGAFSKAVHRFNDQPTLANFALYRLVSRELDLAKRTRTERNGR